MVLDNLPPGFKNTLIDWVLDNQIDPEVSEERQLYWNTTTQLIEGLTDQEIPARQAEIDAHTLIYFGTVGYYNLDVGYGVRILRRPNGNPVPRFEIDDGKGLFDRYALMIDYPPVEKIFKRSWIDSSVVDKNAMLWYLKQKMKDEEWFKTCLEILDGELAP